MEEALLKKIRNRIAERTGLLVRERDDAMLVRLFEARAKALDMTGAEQYCHYLETDAGILQERKELVIAFTTGETYFFRDSGLHQLLQETILPELIERNKRSRVLRIWCAACATGEEAYSLAILLDELMTDQSQWNICILGTDINPDAIEKALRGTYTEWSFRGMSSERRQRYFRRHKDRWILDPRIRSRVTFTTGDLAADVFPDSTTQLSRMDLILCRNAFIYMAHDMVFRIADKFTETLTDGGILIVGHGELYAHPLGKLRVRVFSEAIVYQKVESAIIADATAAIVNENPSDKPTPAASRVKRIAGVLLQQVKAQPRAELSEIQRVWNLANQGRLEMAELSCREMIAKNPLDAEPYYLMALLSQERGNIDAARNLLKKVIYLDPSFIAAYLDLGDCYAREGEFERAIKMRATARDLLQVLPGDSAVKLYGSATASDVLKYVEHLLHA